MLQVSELEHKVQYIEQFANETVEKYQEISNQQQNRQQLDELKEKNKQLKNVSLFEKNMLILDYLLKWCCQMET